MNNLLFTVIALISTMSFAADKSVRVPAAQSSCVRTHTIKCRSGYHVHEVVKGCFGCIADSLGQNPPQDPKTCQKQNNLNCDSNHHVVVDADGCAHCAIKHITEPNCVPSPTIDCATGFEPKEDEQGCFHCVKR